MFTPRPPVKKPPLHIKNIIFTFYEYVRNGHVLHVPWVGGSGGLNPQISNLGTRQQSFYPLTQTPYPLYKDWMESEKLWRRLKSTKLVENRNTLLLIIQSEA
jgi:hypothetical protein